MSPNGLNWIESHTSDSSLRDALQTPLQHRGHWTGWTHPLIEAAFSGRQNGRLPPLADAVVLANDFMGTFNRVLPIFHPPTFMALLGQQYSEGSIHNAAWWASFNAVLAMTQRRFIEDSALSHGAVDTPWIAIKNALDVLLEVLMRNTSLMSVQALTVLAWFFAGTPNPQPGFFLAGAAVRMCHAIGLHQPQTDVGSSNVEVRQRDRVFWAATILDHAASFRTGRPTSQVLQDIKIPLPTEYAEESAGMIRHPKSSQVLYVFRHMVQIATIQARIYQDLYSIHPSTRSKDHVVKTVQLLDAAVADWKDSIPSEYRPDHPRNAWDSPIDLNVVRLHLEYHHCMITIHRLEGHSGFQGLAARAHHGRRALQQSSVQKCLDAARSTLQLIHSLPDLSANSFQWCVLRIFLPRNHTDTQLGVLHIFRCQH